MQSGMNSNTYFDIEQDYEKYQKEDHHVWQLLFDEQRDILSERATSKFLEGIDTVKFTNALIPDFKTINESLQNKTGWVVYAVPGLIDNKPFFELLAQKKFPATTWLRTLAQLKYIEQPDMFHDVFGHVPLLSEPFFAEFLNGISRIALQHIDNPNAIELMARIYWYTIEFGLIKEAGRIKIYGAGILSSPGESIYCLKDDVTRIPYDVMTVFKTPYIKDTFQPQYFVIESYEQLYRSLNEIESSLHILLEQYPTITEGQAL